MSDESCGAAHKKNHGSGLWKGHTLSAWQWEQASWWDERREVERLQSAECWEWRKITGFSLWPANLLGTALAPRVNPTPQSGSDSLLTCPFLSCIPAPWPLLLQGGQWPPEPWTMHGVRGKELGPCDFFSNDGQPSVFQCCTKRVFAWSRQIRWKQQKTEAVMLTGLEDVIWEGLSGPLLSDSLKETVIPNLPSYLSICSLAGYKEATSLNS